MILQDGQPVLVPRPDSLGAGDLGQGSSYRILRSLAQYWLTISWLTYGSSLTNERGIAIL